MPTISQRELRNDSGRVLREAERGGEFIITRRGAPVARLSPLGAQPGGRRPARRAAVFSPADLITPRVSSEQILAELRADR
ncbi:MAG: type II toxin-antitoxin system prevent-host-death family antitoxin [Bifidobacteriaceae bacterium]|jgi:prevent-host-death family protein|nr:type II toxin-antitoxin system prevent-host-death family antitoxin [Bifidobacteriaceae bacterium]